MLQNAYFLAKIGADTAENEQHFAEILPIGRRVADIPPRPTEGHRGSEHFAPLSKGEASQPSLLLDHPKLSQFVPSFANFLAKLTDAVTVLI